jgi:putative ABC transport system substrate-binding protein
LVNGHTVPDATIPIVFGIGQDPVELGLVANLARPGGNATGFDLFTKKVVGKRLGLLHNMVPKAVRVAVLVNPATPSTAVTLQNRTGGARRRLQWEAVPPTAALPPQPQQ